MSLKKGAKLPISKRVGNLFFMDFDTLKSFLNSIEEHLEKPTADSKKNTEYFLSLVKDCLKNQEAYNSAKTDKERVEINGGSALRTKSEKKKETKSKKESK